MNDQALRESVSNNCYDMVTTCYSWGEKLRGYETMPYNKQKTR